MPNTLLLRLTGHLQAWGGRGRFAVRDTALTPTKSGIVGLLCAALGQPDRRVALSAALRMGVRTDKPGTVIEDYHTVQGGRKANGLPRPETMITRRFYLADAAFGVALQGDDPLIRELAAALANPVYVTYLGRLCCIPSSPILLGTDDYPSLIAALGKGKLEIEIDPTPGAQVRMDNVRSRTAHTFLPRFVETFDTTEETPDDSVQN